MSDPPSLFCEKRMTRVALKTQSRKWRPGRDAAALAEAHPPSGQTIDMKHLTAHGSFKSVPTPNRPVSRRGARLVSSQRQTPPRVNSCFEAGTLAQLRSRKAHRLRISLD